MSKNIIFCADGTWNNPDQDENDDHTPDPTNVFKLFSWLDGSAPERAVKSDDEQEKEWSDAEGNLQIAKYIHGVGDSENPIKKLMGGAFGAGVISRVVRGYTFISRNYEPEANIFIVGFSRGAYTARALAGLVASQGLLSKQITSDKEWAYQRGAEAWYRYRKGTASDESTLSHLEEIAADLPAFLTQRVLSSGDLVTIHRISAVAVWDTVGAMGFPDYVGKGKRVDAFKFANMILCDKVTHGFHAVALDERRNDFTPTLWNPVPSVTQVLFPGAHADVGGGYPMVNEESGLSDIALNWMVDRLNEAGVKFRDEPPFTIRPDAAGTAHKPWESFPWTLPAVSLGPRSFPQGMPIGKSVSERMAAGDVSAAPGEKPAPYRPVNLPSGKDQG